MRRDHIAPVAPHEPNQLREIPNIEGSLRGHDLRSHSVLRELPGEPAHSAHDRGRVKSSRIETRSRLEKDRLGAPRAAGVDDVQYADHVVGRLRFYGGDRERRILAWGPASRRRLISERGARSLKDI